MSIRSFYNSIATNSEKVYEAVFVRTPFRYYAAYASYLVFNQGPKLSYYNPYEPEYTKKTVKYNAPVVLGLFAATALLAEIVRNSEQNEKKWWLINK